MNDPLLKLTIEYDVEKDRFRLTFPHAKPWLGREIEFGERDAFNILNIVRGFARDNSVTLERRNAFRSKAKPNAQLIADYLSETGVTTQESPKVTKATQLAGKLSPEERQELIACLRAESSEK